jgi:heavy metal sensor kinase
MTLTNRLSLFFLATLALVLAGFGVALYALASVYLHGQAEERLEATLNTLTAAAEVGPAGVEWEPAQRHLRLGPETVSDQVVWFVCDDRGIIVDQSKHPGNPEFLVSVDSDRRPSERSVQSLMSQGGRWQCGQRRIEPTAPISVPPGPAQADDGPKYPALVITAGVSLEPVRTTLQYLAGSVVGLALAIWLLALVAGRRICRRALAPVTRMSVAVGAMNASDLGCRLPTTATGDELEDLSRAFNSLLDRLQESFERQKRFTADASHQLRTPLTAILGQLEVALRRERSDVDYRRVLKTVNQEASRLRQIVESLLFLARANDEASLPEREHVHIGAWLEAHLQARPADDRAADIQLQRSEAAGDVALVQTALLGELVNIVIDNACKFSVRGTPIKVRLHTEEKTTCIDVQDQGYGIAEDDLPWLFTRFFRSADARRRGIEGVGLGLSIARRLAEALGGTLTATSQVGVGTCLTLRLQRAEVPMEKSTRVGLEATEFEAARPKIT